jgi:GTP-binding protein
VIKVPAGTSAYVKEEGKESLAADLMENGRKVLVARGGKGGKGNVHFATATRKAPEIFQPGEAGQEHDIILKMKQMNDVCIIGMPNSGKSTLLAAISAARPDTAEYPFTTQRPVQAIVDDGKVKLTWAELPALVSGSGQGKGLGNGFLRHAERALALVYLLDAGSDDISAELSALQEEVVLYGGGLADKPYVIAINKADTQADAAAVEDIMKDLSAGGGPVCLVSGFTGQGTDDLLAAVHEMALQQRVKASDEPAPEKVFRPAPVDRRQG